MGQKGNYEANLKVLKKEDFSDTIEDAKKLDVQFEEVKATEEEKKVALVGFDRIADDMKQKVAKLARKKGISSFTLLGTPIRGSVPKFSGGMVGDPSVLVEGLYNMALQRPEIKAVLKITVKALKETELLRITAVSELLEKGVITSKTFNVLDDNQIYDLKKLAEKTKDEVAEFRSIGDKTLTELQKLLTDRGMDFRKN